MLIATAVGRLAVTTLALAFHLLDPLQRDVPGYTTALEDHIESSGSISKQIEALDGEKANPFAKKAATTAKMATLPDLGKAPDFTGIVSWFNIPGDKPLSLSQLKGKVLLVDSDMHALGALASALRALPAPRSSWLPEQPTSSALTAPVRSTKAAQN